MKHTTSTTAGVRRWLSLPELSGEAKIATYGVVEKQSVLSRAFVVMAILSTIIAAYGLLSNSTAVVIGAMLLAPLMGPIFGIALGLLLGDLHLFRRAVIAEVCGVLLVIALSWLIGLIPWHPTFGSEILSRTQPTLLDLFIALASGFAGAYALIDEKVSASLAGVAIATALVPPLATCGLCLSAGRYDSATGAFLLFLANFLAIQVAGTVVFTAFRLPTIHPGPALNFQLFIQRFGMSLLLLLGITVFLGSTLFRLVRDDRFKHSTRTILERELQATTGAHLSEVDIVRRTASIGVMAIVLTPQEFDPQSVARIEKGLRTQVDSRIHLIVRSLISKDADRQGQVFLPDTVMAHQVEAEKETNLLTQVSQELQRQLSDIPGARLIDLRRDSGDRVDVYTAVVRTPTPIEPAQVGLIQASLHAKVTPTLSLVIRSVLTQDADAQQYLYQPKGTTVVLSPKEIRYRQMLEQALRNQLRERVPGAVLQELRYITEGRRLQIFAIVRSPATITATQVTKIQGILRWYIDPTTELVVRSIVGADTGANGYITTFDESRF